jgi:uncharacterized damage-inducible protein DinB
MTPEKASVIAEFLVPHLEREIETTHRILCAVPEEKSAYKPSDKCMSAKDLARHIVTTDQWFLTSVANGQFDRADDGAVQDKTIAELVEIYDRGMAVALQRIRSLPGEKLAAKIKFFILELPAIDIVQVMMKHSVHHRGQLSTYLRPMGAKVPAIYGGSADEPIAKS